MSLRILGSLLVPTMALLFAGYMVLEQYSGGYRASTRNYAVGLGIFIVIFAVLSVLTDVRRILREERAGETAGEVDAEPKQARQRVAFKIGGLVLLTAGFIAALPWAGYILAFFAYSAAILLIVRYRPIWKLVVIAALITAFVHWFFVVAFGLPLPRGDIIPALLR